MAIGALASLMPVPVARRGRGGLGEESKVGDGHNTPTHTMGGTGLRH